MIKNILFDLGHVIIDIDFDRTIQAFRSLGKADFYVALDTTDPVFNDFEVGRISSADFIQHWLDRIDGVTADEIINAWNSLLVGIQPEILPLLKRLEKCYDLYIYSNTNAIHIEWVLKYLKQEYQMDNWVPSPFKAAYYSQELGYRKPDKKGFLKILTEQNLKAEETVFIDDHLPNIHAASALGLQTIHKPAQILLPDILKANDLL